MANKSIASKSSCDVAAVSFDGAAFNKREAHYCTFRKYYERYRAVSFKVTTLCTPDQTHDYEISAESYHLNSVESTDMISAQLDNAAKLLQCQLDVVLCVKNLGILEVEDVVLGLKHQHLLHTERSLCVPIDRKVKEKILRLVRSWHREKGR